MGCNKAYSEYETKKKRNCNGDVISSKLSYVEPVIVLGLVIFCGSTISVFIQATQTY